MKHAFHVPNSFVERAEDLAREDDVSLLSS
jgi:hypothetical protein